MSIDESGAMIHPHQEDAYISESLPFHAPGQVDEHASILSFSTLPLPDSRIDALDDHPELFPDDILGRPI